MDPKVRAALEACARLGCIRVFLGALLPCRLTTDGREWCGTCLAKAALEPEPTEADLLAARKLRRG